MLKSSCPHPNTSIAKPTPKHKMAYQDPNSLSTPIQYGWTYQGVNENSKVAFYEKDGVRMDCYYTTGDC